MEVAGEAAAPPPPAQQRCGICFESFATPAMSTAGCGHYFCNGCWAGAPPRTPPAPRETLVLWALLLLLLTHARAAAAQSTCARR